MMKSLILLFVLLSIACKAQNSYIRIDHIGISDKPIFSIIIGREKMSVKSDIIYIFEKKSFALILNWFLRNDTNIFSQPSGSEFGTFKITVKSKLQTREYYLLRRDDAIKYFIELRTKIDTENLSPGLSVEIKNLIHRITV